MGKKQRREIAAALAAVPENESRVILATGSYIGEGFDDARLDTLFLAIPISWKGTLQQYVGRLHRLHDSKRFVQVYDYVDNYVLMLARMYERRLKGYAAIGYMIEEAIQPSASAVVRKNNSTLRISIIRAIGSDVTSTLRVGRIADVTSADPRGNNVMAFVRNSLVLRRTDLLRSTGHFAISR
jgi:superfamily II DNA or RNA helicase